MQQNNIVMAIDPGITNCGVAVFDEQGDALLYSTTLKCPKFGVPKEHKITQQLKFIHEKCQQIITQYRPTTLVIEAQFHPSLRLLQGALMVNPITNVYCFYPSQIQSVIKNFTIPQFNNPTVKKNRKGEVSDIYYLGSNHEDDAIRVYWTYRIKKIDA